jgi:photosystem II stability/assembly factor-like uncharacterized protein
MIHRLVTFSNVALLISTILFLVFVSFNVTAEEWKQIGPGGQSIQNIVPDRKLPGLWFVKGSGNEPKSAFLSRSVDYGKTWQPTRFNKDVYQVLVHPKTSRVYVVILDAPRSFLAELWVSSDHGRTFQLRTKIKDFFYDRLVIDPSDEARMFRIRTTNGSSSISENGGRVWKELKLPLKYLGCSVRDWTLSDLVVFQGAVYGTATAHLPGCANENQYTNFLLRSTNYGKTWEFLQKLPPSPENVFFAYSFHTDAAFPGRVYILGPNGLWSLSSTQATMISSMRLYSLVSFPGFPEKLSGWSVGRIIQSNDSGVTWTEDTQNLSYSIGDFQALDDGMNGMLGGTVAGLFYRNKDQAWTSRNKGLPSGKPDQIVSVCRSGSRIYTIVWDRFLLRKDGENKPWQNLITQYSLNFDERINRVLANPDNPDHVILFGAPAYGGLATVVLVSDDGGYHWQRSKMEKAFVSGIPGATFDPIDLNLVYYWDEFGIYKSSDKGINVEQISEIRGVEQVVIDPNNTQTLYIIGIYFYKSTDGGFNAHRLAAPPDRRSAELLAPLPSRNSFLLITRSGAILRTDDGGMSWKRISRVELQPDPEQECEHAYYCSPQELWVQDAKNYFVITAAGWFYESTNAGKSWVLKNTNILQQRIHAMTDPKLQRYDVATDHGILQHLR